MKKVLVTGATGFIGRQSLPFLLERGFEVHALCTKTPIETDERVQWHQADLLADDGANETLKAVSPTHLLHFAWYVNPKDYKTSPENGRWVEATIKLLHSFKQSGGNRAVLAGTCMEYDQSLLDEFIKEGAKTSNHNEYAAAKNRTRTEAEIFSQSNGISFAWGRIFNLYGPFEAKERLVPQVVAALTKNTTPAIGTGGLVLDYSYVKDTAGAFVALLDSEVAGPVNIASGTPVSLREMANAVGELLGKSEFVKDINDKKPEIGPGRVVADVTKLKNEVGWISRYDLRGGLEETITWLKESK